MVRALLEGRKTQTRRVAPQPPAECGINYMLGNESWLPVDRRTPVRRTFEAWGGDLFKNKPEKALCGAFEIKPRYQPGDRLYVREAWRPHYLGDGVWDLDVSYVADGARRRIYDGEFGEKDWNWPKAADRGNVTPLHMPRWASRLTLTVTEVRVQRLQEISEEDAIAEGIQSAHLTDGMHGWIPFDAGPAFYDPRDAFRDLWDSLNADRAPWQNNPWIVAISFDVIRQNIDQIASLTSLSEEVV